MQVPTAEVIMTQGRTQRKLPLEDEAHSINDVMACEDLAGAPHAITPTPLTRGLQPGAWDVRGPEPQENWPRRTRARAAASGVRVGCSSPAQPPTRGWQVQPASAAAPARTPPRPGNRGPEPAGLSGFGLRCTSSRPNLGGRRGRQERVHLPTGTRLAASLGPSLPPPGGRPGVMTHAPPRPLPPSSISVPARRRRGT